LEIAITATHTVFAGSVGERILKIG